MLWSWLSSCQDYDHGTGAIDKIAMLCRYITYLDKAVGTLSNVGNPSTSVENVGFGFGKGVRSRQSFINTSSHVEVAVGDI